MKNYIKSSFKRELFFYFVIISIVPLVISYLFLIRMFDLKLASDYKKQDIVSLSRIETKISELFSEYDKTTLLISEEPQIVSFMSEVDTASKNYVYSQLYKLTDGMRDFAQFDIYSNKGEPLFSTESDIEHVSLPIYWGILKQSITHPDQMITSPVKDYFEESDIILMSVRQIHDKNYNCLGFVVIGMTEEDIAGYLSDFYGINDGVILLNEYWEAFYTGGIASDTDFDEVIRNEIIYSNIVLSKYDDKTIYHTKVSNTDFNLVYLRPDILTKAITTSMYSVLLALALIDLLVCVVLSMILSKNLTKPLEDISKAMVLVQKGKLDTRVPVDRNDEFGAVAKNFNDMTHELDNFLKSQISQQKRLNESNIAMLQAQLNPHFLYNTLDTIKWVAKANNVPVIATLSTKLAKILRTSISHKKFVTMKEEMDLIVSYMEIQNIRFEHRFNYKISLEDNVNDLLVPKLIIQTIVENCLIHGFKGSEKGNILIKGYKVEEKLYIEVIDDGVGISEDIANKINKYNSSIEGHIGLNNVKTIIMLYYGQQYGLSVKNINPGTKVTISIPAEGGI